MKLSLNIEIYLNKKNYSIPDVINDYLYFSKFMNEIAGQSSWYLTGSSKKEALEKKLIENGILNTDIKNKFVDKLTKSSPIYGSSIWNGEKNSIQINNYLAKSFDNYKVRLNLILENQSELQYKIKNSILNLIKNNFNLPKILVHTNQYRLNEKNVFPDRLPVGWMLYLNKKITQEQLPMAAELIDIDNNKNKGTLIISTEHVFDGSNKDDIKKANEIEIQLTALGLLPLYTEIYS
ncbi:Imm52 family immunity protein [Providencia rettgeri]|uniref:Imm52 family immunity protein n=1 Tax=Providencia rettgeri TaxID=587 RepID=UPI002362BE66|nr:Imm52 family immunity protein [Providencia rettgeri]EMB5786725.1 immunity 52 family protein [Providencia rettgeri]